MTPRRWWAAGVGLAAVAGWVVVTAAPGGAAGDDAKEVRAGVEKVAELLAGKDLDAARKQAEAVAKKAEDAGAVMVLMGPRKHGGFGFADKAGNVVADDIERTLRGM